MEVKSGPIGTDSTDDARPPGPRKAPAAGPVSGWNYGNSPGPAPRGPLPPRELPNRVKEVGSPPSKEYLRLLTMKAYRLLALAATMAIGAATPAFGAEAAAEQKQPEATQIVYRAGMTGVT